MSARITLTIVAGALKGKTFLFDGRDTRLIGRAEECSPQLPSDAHHRAISRHHCLLDINPPEIRIRDFGSLNGTFVNGTKIGQRAAHETPEQGAQRRSPEHNLHHGDQIELGETVFRVVIVVPAVCTACGAELPEDAQGEGETPTVGAHLCIDCRQKDRAPAATHSFRNRSTICAQCGGDASRDAAEDRHGQIVCAACKANPGSIAQHLLDLARTGDQKLRSIREYTLVKELGKGGMGAVYLARNANTGEQVALKVMLPRIAADERAKQMFLREVENTKALKHPHVVQLKDAGCVNGAFFFTLEYCPGGSVDKLIKQRGGRLSVAEAATITLQALDGLEYAHNVFGVGSGLVHRDLKPHNLFLAGVGSHAKVGDYGLAKAFDLAGLSGQTCSGEVMGTPVFMPRQQLVNFKYAKPEVDVWALAATFYYMLTQSYARDFPEGMDSWLAVLQNSAVPIRERDPSIPNKLAEIIDLALIDQPAIHFKTAAEFKRALEAAL